MCNFAHQGKQGQTTRSGFFARLIHLDAWTMLFWRGLFAGLMILCAATNLYINAFRHLSVADVAVIFAAAPFVTAGLGWLWLGVTEAWTTLAASLVTLLGVSVMVGSAAMCLPLAILRLSFTLTEANDDRGDWT